MAQSLPLKTDSGLAKRWREIMGENNWDGLLEPMDPLLRVELIKYGDLSRGTYVAFDSDLYSRHYGRCKFNTRDFFKHPLMPKVGYKATYLIYAKSALDNWSPLLPKPVIKDWKESDIFIGFIAVSDDETTARLGRRDVCVTWRGTVAGAESTADLIKYLQNAVTSGNGLPWSDPKVRIDVALLGLYLYQTENLSSVRTKVLGEVSRLINEEYPAEEMSITMTGHSIGAATALLSAYDVMDSKANVRRRNGSVVPVSAMTFAGPRVGNFELKKEMESLGVKVLRVVNVRDQVPLVPGFLLNENLPVKVLEDFVEEALPGAYTHVGVKLEFDSAISPFLNPPTITMGEKDMNFHDLNTYIHVIDGYQYEGKGKTSFKSETEWDYALVNCDSGNLKHEYGVPPAWRIDENKGMVENRNGRWVHKSTLIK